MNDYQWFVFEGDSAVPAASGTAPDRDSADREMMHYVMMYGQDGSVRFLMERDGEVLVSGTSRPHVHEEL
jgi:hypothetical protein